MGKANRARERKKNKCQEALEQMREKYPLPSGTSFPVLDFVNDEEAFDALLDSVARGNSVRQFCHEIGLPMSAGVKLNRYLANLKAPDEREALWKEAKRARAHHHADTMLNIINEVQLGTMTSQQGNTCIKGLQWLAERMDPDSFGGRIHVDANLKVDSATQHLEAVRQLAMMVKEDRPGHIYEGDVIEELPPPTEDPFGLLE